MGKRKIDSAITDISNFIAVVLLCPVLIIRNPSFQISQQSQCGFKTMLF